MARFRFKAWWILEDSFEMKVKRLWSSVEGHLVTKFRYLQHGLTIWAKRVRNKRNGLKDDLFQKLEVLLGKDRDDYTMGKILDKIEMTI